ncbi:MAG: TolC family protein [Spirochaetaceae bacterium]
MRRAVIVALVVVVAGSASWAQEDPGSDDGEAADAGIEEVTVIDRETAVQLALANNLGVRIEDLEVRTAKRMVDSAWTVFIPEVSASGRLARVNEVEDRTGLAPVPSSENPPGSGAYDGVAPFEEEGNRWNLSTELSATLSVNLEIIRGIQQTLQQYELGVLNLEDAKAQLRRDVQKQFYELLAQQENVRIVRESIETAQERFEQSEVNYENGLVDEFTVLSSRVQLENLRPQLEQQELAYRRDLMGFKQTLGLDPTESVELDGQIEADLLSLEADALVREYTERRHDIRLAREEVGLRQLALDAKRAERFPTLNLQWNSDPSFAGDPFDDPWFDDIDNDWSQQQGAFVISVIQPLDPLLPFSRTKAEIENHEDEIEQARLRLRQARTGAEIEIRQLVDQLDTARNAIEVRRLNVERAERAFSLAEEAYEAGNRELLEVREAEDDLEEARVQLLEEQKNYVVALLDLIYALNTTLDDLRDMGDESE